MINFFKKIKRRRILSRILSEVMEKRKKLFLNYDKITSVGLAYTVDHSQSYEEINEILNFLKSTDIRFVMLIFEKKEGYFKKYGILQLDSTPNVILIPKGKINWVGVPSGRDYDEVISQSYDCFLFCNSPHAFTMDYTAAKVNSHFTSGMCDSGYSLYTFILSGDDKRPLIPTDYVKQVFHYIKIIKTND
jgi:hypothetical protein